MAIDRDDFLCLLEEYMMSEEAKELEVSITGDAEQDAPLIDSQEKANYFLKLIMNLRRDKEDINALCDAEIAKTTQRVNAFRDERLAAIIKQEEYYEGLLRNYTEHMVANQKRKSIPLPYGTVGLKKQQPKWEYDDEALLEWIKQNSPNLVSEKTTFSVDKKELKKAVELDDNNVPKVNGQEVPGVVVTPQPDKFNITIK